MNNDESHIVPTISTELFINDDPNFYEEDPTTYFLRRNLTTRLYNHDLTIQERQYFMGYDIESFSLVRSDFSDEDVLYCIYQKLLIDLFSDNCTHQKNFQK